MKEIATKSKENKANDTVQLPADIRKAFSANSRVIDTWNTITPIAQRDFVTWIESAKQQETRTRRIVITCDKLLSGKRRPCCYAVVPMNLYTALNMNPKAKATWKSLTPTQKRDFVSSVDSLKNKEEKDIQVQKVCTMLAHGILHL